MDGSRGELQGRPVGSPNKRFFHLPLHLTELAGVPSFPQTPTSPARQAAAATRPGRRHRPSPALSLPRPSPQIAPQ
jgi:hypothetical protein